MSFQPQVPYPDRLWG